MSARSDLASPAVAARAGAVNADALLDAGAVLAPVDVPAGSDTVDTLTTRAYQHPVLDGRTVVRLVPATLGQAEDLTMEFLGFPAPGDIAEVGKVRQQALGFPAWALVHDPANGHHALALVKEIERLARVAKSRIGPAKEGFDSLADRLARSVPHFLPTYYEEAARAFLAADSVTYAASMFGKARDAERVFGLVIDEERQHTVFLEFALAGALTAKALTAHARDLAARADPVAAYQRFRRLCVERTLGGMPPYAAMHTDLKRLAKAAKLDESAEDEVLGELLTAPSIARAPGAFWAAYRPALSRLARRDPAICGRLLGMFPHECPHDVWLSVLEETGATAALTEPAGTVPAVAEPSDGPAGWLARFDEHREGWRRKRLPELVGLVERMAGRLKADGVPVKLARNGDYIDFDLVDACLAVGVPLAEPSRNTRYNVQQWFNDETEGRRDLVALVADERLRAGLAEAIESWLSPGWHSKPSVNRDRVRDIVAVPGLRSTISWWFDRVADRVVDRGLPTLGKELDRVTLFACPEGLAINPGAVRRIVEHELGPVLGRTLRAGVLDELGWPALDRAVADLTAGAQAPKDDEENQFQLVAQWPHLVVRARDQVLVVGGERVELEHLVRIPADQRSWMWRTVFRYVDGQLLVSWDIGRERNGYWSGAPDDVFTSEDLSFSMNGSGSVALPDGGRTNGGRPLRAGDRSEQEVGRVATDGTSYWVWTRPKKESHWYEYDPRTGTLGRESLPAFFEDGAVDGEPLELDECRLLPAAPGMEASPLGVGGGFAGWRVRRTADHGLAGSSTGGHSFALSGAARDKGGLGGGLVGALRFPGSGETYGVLWSTGYRENRVTLCTPDGFVVGRYKIDGTRPKYAAGTRLLPAPAYWNYLRPRDGAGSAALRQLTDEVAGTLLSGADGLDAAEVATLVRAELPQITSAELVAGVAGVVRQAAKHRARLAKFARVAAGEPLDDAPAAAEETEPADAAGPTDKLLATAMRGFMPYCYDRGRSAVRMIAAAGALLDPAGQTADLAADLVRADHDWYQLLSAVPVAMFRAVSPATPPDQREALLGMLDACAASGLLTERGRLRMVWWMPPAKVVNHHDGQVATLDGRRMLILDVDESDGELKVLDFAPDGAFTPLPGYKINREYAFGSGMTGERVAAFVATARERGPVPWRTDPAGTLSRDGGISLAEAAVLLAGVPTREAWDATVADPAISGAAVDVALSTWQERNRAVVQSASACLLPPDAVALWDSGPDTARLAEWLTQWHGARTPVDDELIVAAHRARLGGGMPVSELLHGLANPATCRWLAGRVDGVDDGDLLVGLVKAVPWLVYRLPTGDPVREALPAAVELARRRLADPELVIDVGYLEDKKIKALAGALGVPVVSGEHGIDMGAVFFPPDDGWRQVQLRPSRLTGADDPILGVVQTRLDSVEEGPLAAVRALLGDQLTDWVGYRVPDGAGGAEHDPSRAAPALVAEVAAARGIGADAAALYLQLLALPDPTDRNVAAWTGWKPARLKAARAELAATDLVVEAKRARAGRTLFLPGGWLALRAPHLPLELWKLPLLVGGTQAISGLDMVIPVAPVPRLFEVAWTRVTAGDVPRFDDLVTERRR